MYTTLQLQYIINDKKYIINARLSHKNCWIQHWIHHVSLLLDFLTCCHYLLWGAEKKTIPPQAIKRWQGQVKGWIWKGSSCMNRWHTLAMRTSRHDYKIVHPHVENLKQLKYEFKNSKTKKRLTNWSQWRLTHSKYIFKKGSKMFFKENLMQIFSFRTPYHLTTGPLRSEKENWNKTPAAECPPLPSTLWGCVGQDSIMESRVGYCCCRRAGQRVPFLAPGSVTHALT